MLQTTKEKIEIAANSLEGLEAKVKYQLFQLGAARFKGYPRKQVFLVVADSSENAKTKLNDIYGEHEWVLEGICGKGGEDVYIPITY